MARWRRPGVDELLLVLLLLAAAGSVCSWLSHSQNQNDPLSSFLVTAFLAWRVSRGGRISRMLLILGSGASYAAAVLDVARLWNAGVAALLVVGAAQVALLVVSMSVLYLGWGQATAGSRERGMIFPQVSGSPWS